MSESSLARYRMMEENLKKSVKRRSIIGKGRQNRIEGSQVVSLVSDTFR